MSLTYQNTFAPLSIIAQRLSVFLVLGLAIFMLGLSISAAVGWLPWLVIPAQFGDFNVADMGQYLQVFFTVLCVTIAFYLPSQGRMMRLETSHRKFHLTMTDVARAYRKAHEADRQNLFKTGEEFDAVRERISHLRNHPDLSKLEPEVMEMAAQMSFQSRELAQIYDTTKVERAKTFLRQRHEEMETFQSNLKLAKTTIDELKHWLTQVEADELIVSKQVDTLEADLTALLPKLGFEVLDAPSNERRVVPLATKTRKPSTDTAAPPIRSNRPTAQNLRSKEDHEL